MNHARICKNYYGNTKENLYPLYPELKRFELYFNAIKARDWYYNAMKYHAIHLIKNLIQDSTLKQIGNIVDLDHATVLHYLKKYTPITGHKEFISENFEKFIENQIYPLKPKNYKDLKKYGAFKPTKLEEVRQYSKSIAEKKEKTKEKRNYTSIKNPAEKY